MIKYVYLMMLLATLAACNPSKVTISNVQATDLQGNKIDWAKYQGKAVFFHFWATWCRDCLVELPQLIALAQSYQGNDKIVFIFASDEELARQQAFLAANPNLPFEFVKLEKTLKENDIIYIPQTYLYDAKGKLVLAARDKITWTDEAQKQLIEKAIKGE